MLHKSAWPTILCTNLSLSLYHSLYLSLSPSLSSFLSQNLTIELLKWGKPLFMNLGHHPSSAEYVVYSANNCSCFNGVPPRQSSGGFRPHWSSGESNSSLGDIPAHSSGMLDRHIFVGQISPALGFLVSNLLCWASVRLSWRRP